jgi:hypothetical protein
MPLTVRGDTVGISFLQINYESNEYIPLDRLTPRPSGMFVVRTEVAFGWASGAHIEEWVMGSAMGGLMSLRIFGYFVN